MPATRVKDGVDTRTRIVDAAARRFAVQGYAGTGLKAVAEDADAPFGSIYHFFPGGKDQLAEHMIRTQGPEFMAMVLAVLDERDDPLEALTHCFTTAAERLVASGYADACPIATMALDVASVNEPLRQASADAFSEWVDAGTAWFGRWIADAATARDLATSFVMLTEGAFMLSRAAREIEPLAIAGRTMTALTRAHLRDPSPGPMAGSGR